jgi:seryl-tRNA(Sec) selenium transferase
MIANIDTTAGREVTLGTIEGGCQRYDAAASLLDEQIAALEADLTAVKQKHLRQLTRQAAIVAALEAELRAAVENTPDLFKKPRTFILHGVKVGLTTSNGKLVWDLEDEELVSLLKRKFKDDDAWKGFVNVTEVPSKEALRLLDAPTLAKLGCRIDGAGDAVVLKRTSGDVEKMMDKLIEKMVGAMVAED